MEVRISKIWLYDDILKMCEAANLERDWSSGNCVIRDGLGVEMYTFNDDGVESAFTYLSGYLAGKGVDWK